MSNNHPLVSIVTPSFNAQLFIRETIESVLTQEYQNLEHIVIDGESSDGTVDIIKEYSSVVWVSEPDSGQSQAINKGFLFAKGEIIGWLNADDTYNPGAIKFAVNHFIDSPDVDLIFGDVQIIDAASKPVAIKKGRQFDLHELLINNYVRQPTVFFRRSILDEVGGLDESLHYCMDREFWLRIGTRFKIQYVQGPPRANFRVCEGTKTFSSNEKFQAEWLSILQNTISDPRYQRIPLRQKQFAIHKYQVDYRVACIRKAQAEQDWKTVMKHTSALGKENWRYILKYPFVKIGNLLNR